MKCEACGGDGQIEYGAYRGDEAGPTRECRLCGGPKVVVDIPAGTSMDNAVKVLTQLGQAAARASHSIGKWGSAEDEQRKAALRTASEVAKERLEQLRLENERLQREAERDTNDTMNDLIRRGML